MKFGGNTRGKFVQFNKVGDQVAGRVVGVRVGVESKFGPQTVLDLIQDDGTAASVGIGKSPKDLAEKLAAAEKHYGGTLMGHYVFIKFDAEYKSPKGGNPGKNFQFDVDENEGPTTPPVPAAPATGDEVEKALARVTEKLGAERAMRVLRAIESTEKDKSKHAAKLLAAAKLS